MISFVIRLVFRYGKGKNKTMTAQELNAEKEEILIQVGEESLAKEVVIRWNARMRSTAGRAHLTEGLVELNPRLMAHGTKEILRTLRHELAHLLAWKRARCRTHGRAWQEACADLGIPGERATHQLPFPVRRQTKRWAYHCPSCKRGIQRVRRARRPSACAPCCRQHNGGRYTKRYGLVESKISPPQED